MSKQPTIWIVDDDSDDREILRDAFETNFKAAGYDFMENGDVLMDQLAQNASNGLPSIIMLDLNMPGKDGREALKEIKSNKAYQKIPVIVFTTSSSQRDKDHVYELGANCFITKPDTFDKLVSMAHHIVNLWLEAAS